MMLLYLQTQAVQTQSPEVELGRSMYEWLSRMGIPVGGNTYRMVREQANHISACHLTFFWEDGAVGERIREIARRLGRSPSSISDEIDEIRLVDDIIPSVRTKPQKHESTTLIRNTCSRPAQRCNPMSLESWDLAGRPSRSREDCGKRSTKGYDHRRSTSTMSPFTSTSMMSRRVSCDCGRSSRGAIGNDGAGWAGKAGR